MNKFYSTFLILLISSSLYSQINVEANDMGNAHIKFIDKITKKPVNSDVWTETEPFVNGFAKVAKDGKWGLVDGQGHLVVKNEFNDTRNFVHNLAAVSKNGKWGFVNEKGQQVIPCEYEIIYDFTEEITAGYKDNKWFLVNKYNNIIKALKIDIFWGFKNGIAKIDKDGQTGLMDINGNIISLEPKKDITPKKMRPIYSRPNLVESEPCPTNIDFEFGNFTNWICYEGTVAVTNAAGVLTNVITVTPNVPATTPSPGRHTMIPRAVPTGLDPLGLFPTNPPDGSNFALKLGNDINGKEAERVSYLINVPAGSIDASITYRYAVVFEDPGHLTEEQPRFSAKLFIQNGNVSTPIPCASYDYIADTLLPGFFTSPLNPTVRCKAWTSVFVNLSAYAGQTVRLEFTTADCALGAHWGYAYVDVGDCNITANINYSCNPSTASLLGPPGFEFYNWWNYNYTTLLSTQQNPILTPAPALGSTLHVEVVPFNGSGCRDTLHVLVSNNNPAVNAGPDKTICLGDSASIGAAGIAGNTYSWSPTTYLSNPNIANPKSSPPVTTTYYLTVTNIANACSNIDSVIVNINPIANVVQVPDLLVCDGNSTSAINFTGSFAGTTFNWTNSNTTIGLAASGTGNIPTFVATNNTNAQIAGTITVTPTANGCSAGPAKTFLIKVNPTASVVQAPDQVLCNGSSTSMVAFSGAIAGTTYNWTNTNTAIGLGASGTGNIPAFVATNNTNAQIAGTITVTPTASGCPGPAKIFLIKVNPAASVVQEPDQALCNGSSTSAVSFSGAVAGTTYNWTNTNTAIGLGTLGTGNIPTFVATNNTNAQITGIITVTPTANGCPGPVKTFLIRVNPTPSVAQAPDQVLCNAVSTTAVSFSGAVSGTTYNWTNTNTAIGLGASGSSNIPAFVATNNTNAQIVGTITVTPTASGCPGLAKTFLIKVNPAASVVQTPDQELCNGSSTSAVSFSGAVAGTTYNWTNNNTAIGLGASGTGNIPTFAATNNTNAQITGTITVTPTANGCPGPVNTFLIQVNPTPSVVQAPDQMLCNGSSTSAVSFSGAVAGTTYNWTNTNTAIGLGASGTSNIPTFATTNNTNAQIAGTITVTPTANGCPGPVKTFLINVNPTPSVAQAPDQVLCNGSSTSAVSFSGAVGGTTYNWTNTNTAIGLGTSGTGNIPTFAATNNTNAQITGTITVTPTASGCTGTAKIFLIKVNPTPSVAQAPDQVLCNGSSTSAVSFSGAVAGTTYNWTNTNTAIGLGASGTGNIPTFVATNNTNAQITGTITVTPTANGCPGTAKTFLIKVNHTPSVAQAPDQELCNGSSTSSVSLSSAVESTNYIWTNTNTAIGLGASGTGNIPTFVATNNTNAQIAGTITITPIANGCPGPAITFLIKVNPTPSVAQAPDQVLCNGSSTSAVSFSGAVAGTTYNWTNTNTTIGLGASGTGNIPTFVAINNTNAQIAGTITVTPTASGCPGPAKTFLIKVNTTPSVSQAPDQVLCNGSITSAVSFSGAVAGTNYFWTNTNTAIGLGASGTGNIPTFIATNNTNAQIAGTITVTPTASGCPGPAKTFLIKVNPTASVVQAPDQVLCNGSSTSAVSFSGAVAGANYNWTNSNTAIGLGVAGTGNIPTFVATNSNYAQIAGTITVTPTANGCSGPAITFLINVNPTPSVVQAPDEELCNGSSTTAVSFSGAVAGTNYIWTNTNTAIGLGASGTGNIPTFVATNNTNAQITGTITVTPSANSCTGPAITFLKKINPTPSVVQAPDQVLCNGSNSSAVSFSGAVAGTNYNWTNTNTAIGLGASGTGNIPTFVATNNTNAQIAGTITVTPTANGCLGPAKTFLINVNPTPSVVQTPDQELCNGSSTSVASFSGAVAGTNYIWTNTNTAIGLGASGTGNIPTFVATNNTNAQTAGTITVTPTASGCPGPAKIFLIKVNPTALVTQVPDQMLCANTNTTAINFSGNVVGTIYNWTNSNTTIGLGASGTGNIPAFATTNTTYSQITATITVAANINGCAGPSKSFTIKVNPSINIQASNDIAICKSGNTPLSANGSQNFEWTPSTGLSCTNCPNPIASPDSTTIYTVNAFPNTGCQRSDSIKITVHQPIHINLAPDRQICAKEPINLWANGASSYIWSPRVGLNNSTSPNPIANVNQNTTFMVIGSDNHNCFKDTGYIAITVLPNPTIQLGADQTLSTGTIFPLTSVITNGPIVSWLWTPSTDLSCNNCPKPLATVKKDITYTVLVKNIFGCTATDDIRIRTICEGSQVFVPNAFTPDGDGKNDVLMVRSKGIGLIRSFKIYSRWGELIFEKTNFQPNNPAFGWDGKIKGVTGSAEVYVYIVEAACDNLQNYTIKGNVSILK